MLFVPFGEGNSAHVSVTVVALEDAYDLFETICQIRGDDLDDADTHERVHPTIVPLVPCRKLKQLPIWNL